MAATRRPSGVRPEDLAARDHRQGLLGQVVVAGGVRVGEVDARPCDLDHDLALAGLGVGDIDELHDLGAPELLNPYRSHGA